MNRDGGTRRAGWGRWFGRPGRSLTRRLIWLASGWILLALVATGLVLTNQFKESALRRLGNVLAETTDELVVRTVTASGTVMTPQIMDAPTLRVFSGKYWMTAEPTLAGGLRILTRSDSLYGEDLVAPPDLPARVNQVKQTIKQLLA